MCGRVGDACKCRYISVLVIKVLNATPDLYGCLYYYYYYHYYTTTLTKGCFLFVNEKNALCCCFCGCIHNN